MHHAHYQGEAASKSSILALPGRAVAASTSGLSAKGTVWVMTPRNLFARPWWFAGQFWSWPKFFSRCNSAKSPRLSVLTVQLSREIRLRHLNAHLIKASNDFPFWAYDRATAVKKVFLAHLFIRTSSSELCVSGNRWQFIDSIGWLKQPNSRESLFCNR